MLTSAFLLVNDVTRAREGDVVLMHSAAGGIGSAVAQLVGGLRIGTVGRAAKVPDALAAGWDVVLPRDDDTAVKVRAAAGRGVDVVLDPLGTSALELDLAVAAPGARIALFGNPAGGVPDPLPPLGRLIGGNVALAGFSISRLAATAPDRAATALRQVLDLLATGRLAPRITVVDRLEGVAAVHDRMAAGGGVGKSVVAVAG
jgi:NADPH2:quinone reductase